MNLFADKLPDTISVRGKDYPIHTDFRVWVQVEQLFSASHELSVSTLVQVLQLVFAGNAVPDSLSETMAEIFAFFNCGEKAFKKGGKAGSGGKRVVSFSADSKLIYAAFLAQYRIDLINHTGLHWFLFRALFDGLWDTHQISKVMRYRSEDLARMKDKERRRFYKEMQERYKLPDNRSVEEIERDNMANLEKLF